MKRVFSAVVVSVFVGVLIGTYEGMIYSPPENHWLFWGLLILILLSMMTFAIGIVRAVVAFPLCLVAQDAASLLAQGARPLTATWYTEWFGHNFLTQHFIGLPGFYTVGFALTLFFLFMLEVPDLKRKWV